MRGLINQIKPRYFSKNSDSLAIMPCFLTSRPPPNRETDGRILSISVPVVFSVPSRNERSTNLRVSASLSFSSWMIVTRSVSSCSWTNRRQSSSTLVDAFTVSIKCSISSFLLRSWILEPTALSIEARMLLSLPLESRYFATSMRI